MRIGMILLGLLIFLTAGAQRVIPKGVTPKNNGSPQVEPKSLYHIADFQGRWQEVSRKGPGGKHIIFSDTLQLWFTGANVYSKDASSMRMSMMYEAELPGSDWLIIGTDGYRVKSLSQNVLILEDEQYLRTFRKMQKFYYELVGKDSVVQDEPGIPLHANTSALLGKWVVYKSVAPPGLADAQTALINSIELRKIEDSVTAVGSISYRLRGARITDSATLNIEGRGIRIKSPSLHIKYDIFKADGVEFIFGNQPGIVFYAKKFAD
ncbi:MAG: hypothetical protein IT254_06100 [Chitinophagaceae bacterium]|nr:hypothetical protein [Bacteroidota bacterium]MCC6257873.1 hypothetical protein [Chitinophagaceae bacterium]MCW5916188.1 hypothetical protein [Ferruginibacter sp.]